MGKAANLPLIKTGAVDTEGAKLGAPLLTLKAPPDMPPHRMDDFCAAANEQAQRALLGFLKDTPGLKKFLEAVFQLSPYLADLARQFPDTVASCADKGFRVALDQALNSTELTGHELLDQSVVMRTLRQAKRKAALICGLADLGGWWSCDFVSRGIARTADATLQTCVRHLLLVAHNAGKLQLPDASQPELGSGYTVIAMGKHGANELNYSSDIDLIVFFDPDAPAIIDREESVATFGRLTKTLVKIMQDSTEDGYVFRTDLRLRPDPGSMPLAIPVGLAMHYYESRGQNWERAALIKARVAAGDIETGQNILKELEPFIWRRYLDYAAIADVHSIKRQIQAHKGYSALNVPGHNVKLGRGGIREIEFFVQTQQLIAGGRIPELRGKRTLEMMDALVEHEWIEPNVRDDLTASYAYLRDIEHRLQMVSDAQTHIIPDTDDGLLGIALLSGFPDVESFSAATAAHLTRVENHYSDLFSHEPELAGAEGNLSFTGDDDDPGTVETFAILGYERPSDMIALVRGWHFGRYRAMQSRDARERLTEITPQLIHSFAKTGKPDDALIAFDAFLQGLPGGFQLFNMLRANPNLMDLLVMVLGVAPRLAKIITRKPHVFDGLLEPGFFNESLSREGTEERLARALSSSVDYEDGLNRARLFASEQKFLIGMQLLGGTISHREAGATFTMLAETMLSAMLDWVLQEFEQRHGKISGAQMAIVGMGNLGTRELTASSDLDLIVLYQYKEEHDESDGEKPLHASQYFARITQRLIAAMSAPTAEGVIYELDFRLRPSGNSGPLATTLSSFLAYQEDSAWTWEKLALTRARAVIGHPGFLEKVQTDIDRCIGKSGEPETRSKETLEMRLTMDEHRPAKSVWDVKLSAGGLIDIEFLGQWARLLGIVDEQKSTRASIEQLVAVNDTARDANLLKAFDFYTRILQVTRVCLDEAFDIETVPAGLLSRLINELNVPDIQHAQAQLLEHQKSVRACFVKLLSSLED